MVVQFMAERGLFFSASRRKSFTNAAAHIHRLCTDKNYTPQAAQLSVPFPFRSFIFFDYPEILDPPVHAIREFFTLAGHMGPLRVEHVFAVPVTRDPGIHQ